MGVALRATPAKSNVRASNERMNGRIASAFFFFSFCSIVFLERRNVALINLQYNRILRLTNIGSYFTFFISDGLLDNMRIRIFSFFFLII